MTTTTATPRTGTAGEQAPSTAELTAALTAAAGPVATLRREASPLASTAALESVRVELADGQRLDLLLKAGGRRTRREAAVYREVLTGAGLRTPRLVAASGRGGGWLLLEELPGGPLWQSADVESWCAAARWVAGAHSRLARHAAGQPPAEGCAFEAQLERAVRRDERAERLRGPAARAAAALRVGPHTVVHGEAFPSNVLIGPAGEVCLVDWETAGRGPALLDLAALCVGWPAEDAARIAAAYAAAVDRHRAATRPAATDRAADTAVDPAAHPAADPAATRPAADPLALLPAARLAVAVRWLGEPRPAVDAGGGHAHRTDWYAEAVAAAELLP